MSPIQQMLLGVGAVDTKTYVDDVFSTYLYKGNSGSQTINNSIDFSGEGGLLWLKNRDDSATQNILTDTVRGVNEVLYSDANNGEASSNMNQSFNSNGWSMNCSFGDMNQNNKNYTSWSFRRASGFFTICEWTGNGTAGRQISHDLGSVPGCVMVKCTSHSEGWAVYHRGIGATKRIALDSSGEAVTTSAWNSVSPTSTYLELGSIGNVNETSKSYVAYLFAGGESDAATACSVNFNASSDYLTTQSSSYGFGTGDFTIEFWTKLDTAIGTNATATPGFFQLGTTAGFDDSFKFMVVRARNDSGGRWQMLIKGNSTTNATTYSSADGDYPHPGQWYHVALVRHSSKTSLYINGELKIGPIDDTTNYNFDDMLIGGYYSNNYGLDGQISNFRIVKGSAVYTSSFKPPTEPLTSITNTELLCCQSSTITAATTIPGTQTISSNGSPSANTSHSFDDPAGFVFGENEDQNVIKTGSYIGNGSSTGPEINLGWEPQWILYKCIDANESWTIYDSMRGIVTGGNEKGLYPNSTNNEQDQAFMDLTPTGYKITSSDTRINGSSKNYVYVALRRSDGYCGKPSKLGTGVFSMDYGSSSSTIPTFDSGFPVDFSIVKKPAATDNWYTGARLVQTKSLKTDTTDAEATYSNWLFDSNVGWATGSNNTYLSYNWKRHAGFDCISFKGNGVAGRQIRHNLGPNNVPEMMWIKNRDSALNWIVYHKGLNGGTNPEKYYLRLNTDDDEIYLPDLGIASNILFNDTPPTSTVVTLGSGTNTNENNSDIMMLLFSSVEGISKVGSYTGNGSSNGPVITTNFAPRFVLIKCTSNSSTNWKVFDTTRGIDKDLSLNTTDAQADDTDWMDLSSTGFQLADGDGETNGSSREYIYYAHA